MTNQIQEVFAEVHKEGISPAVLLIHGFGGSPFDLEPLTREFEKKGYAFKSIVLPGHGTSPQNLLVFTIWCYCRGIREAMKR